MIGESLVAELKATIKKLKYRSAVWEWAIWARDAPPRLHLLKITLNGAREAGRQNQLFRAAGLSLFRSTSSLKKVIGFLDYCLSTRREFEKTNKIPFGEAGFQLGKHKVELFGNFLRQNAELCGSAMAKTHWFFKSNRPFFLAEYALHDSVKPQIPHLSFYDANPPFASLREAYLHHFGVDIGERRDPWVGLILPVHLASIRSWKVTSKELRVEIDGPEVPPGDLSLSVVCRGPEGAVFRERLPVAGRATKFPLHFLPTSLDLALHARGLQIDLMQWQRPGRRIPAPPALSALFTEDHSPYDHQVSVLFDPMFLEQQPPDIRICLEQADKCGAHALWVPASMMLRKTLEMAINLKMKQLGKENELHDEKGQERSLTFRLQALSNYLPRLQRDLRDLLTIKWFGDKGAHTKMPIYESDVRSLIAPRIRAFLAGLELTRTGRRKARREGETPS
jgi:hypothetical protein